MREALQPGEDGILVDEELCFVHGGVTAILLAHLAIVGAKGEEEIISRDGATRSSGYLFLYLAYGLAAVFLQHNFQFGVVVSGRSSLSTGNSDNYWGENEGKRGVWRTHYAMNDA